MDFNTKLIELVKNYKSIYDTNDPSYGDNARRHEAWKEIARKLETHEKECKKSWILLREGYRRSLKKKIASEIDPGHRKDALTRKWTYEDDMSFLSPHFKKRYLCSINNDINVEENCPDRDTPAIPATPEVTNQKRALLKRTRTHEVVSRRSCSLETHSNTLIKYILDKTMKRDHVQQFFDSMSSTVQSFPPRDKALAKARVFEVISRMELEILNRESATSSQYTGSPASDDMEVTESRNNLYISSPPVPCRPSSGMLEANNSGDEIGPELDIKIEPEQILGLNIKTMGKDDKEDSGFGFKDKAKAVETLRLLEQHDMNYRRLTVRGLLGRAKRVLSMTKAEDKIKNIKEAMEVFEQWLADLADEKNKKTDKKDDKREEKKKVEKKSDSDDSSSSSDVEMEDKKPEKKELPPDSVPGLGFKDAATAEGTLKELKGRDPDYQKLAVKGLIGRAKRVLTCTRDETKISNIKEAMSIFEKFLDDFDSLHLSKQSNPYVSLGIVRTAQKLAGDDVSEQQKAFIVAYSSVRGEYKRLRTAAAGGDQTWDIVRNSALQELKEKHADVKLFNEKDEPTAEHLEMLLWAYSPEPARVKKYVPETKEEKENNDRKRRHSEKETESSDRKRRSSGRDDESPSKKSKE